MQTRDNVRMNRDGVDLEPELTGLTRGVIGEKLKEVSLRSCVDKAQVEMGDKLTIQNERSEREDARTEKRALLMEKPKPGVLSPWPMGHPGREEGTADGEAQTRGAEPLAKQGST